MKTERDTKKVLLVPGLMEYGDFLKIVKNINNDINIEILLNHKKQLKTWSLGDTNYKIWSMIEPEFLINNFTTTPYHKHYDYVLNELLRDSRSYYLLERKYSIGGSKTVFNHTVKLEKLVWNSLSLLYKIRPVKIVLPTTPHSQNWFFVKVAELINIKVIITPTSPLPWKSWVVTGLEDQTPVELPLKKSNNESVQNVFHYLNKIRSCYSEAIPEYEKNRLNKYKGKVANNTGDILQILNSKSIYHFFNRIKFVINKRRYLSRYNSLSKDFKLPKKYVAFFLHFQPERTTLPEGNKFVQQWLAVRAISAALPKDHMLVVKEHPSMFTNNFSIKVRDQLFYRIINSMNNVVLSPINISPFQLIDNSIAIATITGTVGVEALIRHKPVIVFGIAQYRKFNYVYYADSLSETKNAINEITQKKIVFNKQKVEKDLMWANSISFEKDKTNISIKALSFAINLGL